MTQAFPRQSYLVIAQAAAIPKRHRDRGDRQRQPYCHLRIALRERRDRQGPSAAKRFFKNDDQGSKEQGCQHSEA